MTSTLVERISPTGDQVFTKMYYIVGAEPLTTYHKVPKLEPTTRKTVPVSPTMALFKLGLRREESTRRITMIANTESTATALVRRRNSVLTYFGINPHDRRERAAFYGRVTGRAAIAGAFLVGAIGYLKSLGMLL